jgi:hypothetical protein
VRRGGSSGPWQNARTVGSQEMQLACRTRNGDARRTNHNSSNSAACSVPWYVDCPVFILSWYIANGSPRLAPLRSLLIATLRFLRSTLDIRTESLFARLLAIHARFRPRLLRPVRASRCFSSRHRSCRHESCCVQRPSPFPVNVSPRRRTNW